MHSRATYDVNHVDLLHCYSELDSMISALKAVRYMLQNDPHSDPEVNAAWCEGVVASAVAIGTAIAAELEACDARLKAHPGNPASEAVR